MLTYEQILASEDPYKDILEADGLVAHLNELIELNEDEQFELATKMMSKAPTEKLYELHATIEAAKANGHISFYDVLSQAYGVRNLLERLKNPETKNLDQLLLGKEFEPGLFENFNELSNNILNGSETSIAISMAISTSREKHSEVARALNNIFPNSTLGQEVRAAFAFRREVDSLLVDQPNGTGYHPELFFTSRDFSVEMCGKFNSILVGLIAGNEEKIGTGLAKVESSELRAQIALKLEQINPNALDPNSPFKLIAKAMTSVVIADPVPPAATESPTPATGKPPTRCGTTPGSQVGNPFAFSFGSSYNTQDDNDFDQDADVGTGRVDLPNQAFVSQQAPEAEERSCWSKCFSK